MLKIELFLTMQFIVKNCSSYWEQLILEQERTKSEVLQFVNLEMIGQLWDSNLLLLFASLYENKIN